jgi:hypothetical protein
VSPAKVRASVASSLNVSGSAPIYAARAWVNFNGGTSVIRASGNINNVVRSGVGIYRINFLTAMQDANYCPVFGATVASDGTPGIIALAGGYNTGSSKTSSYLDIQCRNALDRSFADFNEITVTVFR